MNIEAILFDLDGVLVDSEKVIGKISIEVFAELGINVTMEDIIPFMGGGDKYFVDNVAKLQNKTVDFESTFNKIYNRYYESDIPLVKGALKFVKQAKDAGIKIAIVSSARKKKIIKNLNALGLGEDYFDLVVSGENMVKNKPEPHIYQYAALNLKVPYENCIVFEDSLLGVTAANRAKCNVMALSTNCEESDLLERGAMFVFEDFNAIDDFDSKEQLTDFLEECIKDDRIQYGAVKCFEKQYPLPHDKLLADAIKIAYKARKNAYTPYSHYNVGAAVVSAKTNNIYPGCNVENASFGATICAERGAIMSMLAKEGETGIKMIVVVTQDNPPAPPCALCLQVLSEFSKSDTEIHLVDIEYAKDQTKGVHETYKFIDLLPNPFVLK
ncbi:MAG: cytidine deaminase [Pleomorphochaeta sp.]